MRQTRRVGLLLVALLASKSLRSQAAITISCPTVSSGGGVSTSAMLSVFATLGQPLTGRANGVTLSINAGLWPCNSPVVVGVDMPRGPAFGANVPAMSRITRITPNPFDSRTRITFDVASPVVTKVRVFDAMGRLIRTLIDGTIQPGSYNVTWDGAGLEGMPVGSGVYYCQFRNGPVSETRRITLVR